MDRDTVIDILLEDYTTYLNSLTDIQLSRISISDKFNVEPENKGIVIMR